MQLKFLPGEYSICKLPIDSKLPEWVAGELQLYCRTTEGVTVVCLQREVPAGVESSRGWSCMYVDENLDFDLVGVIAELSRVLALAKIPIFVVSAFETDYVLVPHQHQEVAKNELRQAGYNGL